jgi:hypothetical protein
MMRYYPKSLRSFTTIEPEICRTTFSLLLTIIVLSRPTVYEKAEKIYLLLHHLAYQLITYRKAPTFA